MTNEELEKKIDDLKNAATVTLNKLLNIPDGYEAAETKKFVDYIVSAALLEVAYSNKRAMESYKEVRKK